MNRFETWFCGSAYWRYVTRRQLLPWILQGSEIGDHVLELGAGPGAAVIQANAAALPFADATFSSAIAILMLHHLRSRELQDRAFAEIARVLRPSGVFLGFEIQDSWLHRVGHIRSTFVPVDPRSASSRLTKAGFSQGTVDFWRAGFRIRSIR
jgi:SAM-dependent methyltransferase